MKCSDCLISRAAHMSSRTENQNKMCRLYVSAYSRIIGGGKGLYYLLSSGNEEKTRKWKKGLSANMRNIKVKDINGNIVINDGKDFAEWIDGAKFDKRAIKNKQPMKLIVVSKTDGANFCGSCGSRNLYCVRESKQGYQLVCRDCGYRIGFRVREDMNESKNSNGIAVSHA